MLSHLHIRNFAIIPALNLDIPQGFTAITGETGAGKSILVDALGLLLGERSDAGWVRTGAERAELTAEFIIGDNPEALAWLENAELSADDCCLLRRTISRNGRSRAYINGSPVTVAQMQSLGYLLVEIHGQNEHLRLNNPAEQFKLLDKSGAYTDQLKTVENAFERWHSVQDEMTALEAESAISPTDLEFLNFQLEEMQQYDLSPGAIDTLQQDHDRLAAGGSLQEALSGAIELLDPPSATDSAGIVSDIHKATRHLLEFAKLDKNIAEACKMLDEALVNCTEAGHALQSALDRVDLDPGRFDQLAATLGRIHDLARKHRVRMEELAGVRNALAQRIDRAGSAENLRTSLQKQLDQCLADYRIAAADLNKVRREHARTLSDRVMQLMTELGMAGGSFEIAVKHNADANPSRRGDDTLQILISANPGHPAGPINKIASGGELSRISLAIKVAAVATSQSITQVFDEVDAGIGGDTANAVGRLLSRLAGDRRKGNGQALCVTHLAQVAVCAAHHLRVQKANGKDTTNVSTQLLGEDERIDEVSRMLSGNISEQSRAHAIELLNNAGQQTSPSA